MSDQQPAVADRQFLFDRDELMSTARSLQDTYAAADPFPHIVIDGFLPEWVIDAVVAEFPGADADMWQRYDTDHELKLESDTVAGLPPTTRALINEFNGAVFVEFLQTLTGIPEPLISDPLLDGGGLHQIVPGGKLDVHADFNKHLTYDLDRRINALLYLNEDWQDEWGGHLELWNTSMSSCVQRIAPIANRLVVFSTTSTSYHGHPTPLRAPAGRTRRSIALYYYSNGRSDQPGGRRHSTTWQARPGERSRAKEIARKVTPPIVLDGVRAIRNR